MLAGSPESQHRSWGHQTYLTGLTTVEDDTPSFGPGAPVLTHPLIVKNPTTGRRSIFITPFITTKITGIPAEESDAIIALSCKALCPPGLPMQPDGALVVPTDAEQFGRVSPRSRQSPPVPGGGCAPP